MSVSESIINCVCFSNRCPNWTIIGTMRISFDGKELLKNHLFLIVLTKFLGLKSAKYRKICVAQVVPLTHVEQFAVKEVVWEDLSLISNQVITQVSKVDSEVVATSFVFSRLTNKYLPKLSTFVPKTDRVIQKQFKIFLQSVKST